MSYSVNKLLAWIFLDSLEEILWFNFTINITKMLLRLGIFNDIICIVILILLRIELQLIYLYLNIKWNQLAIIRHLTGD